MPAMTYLDIVNRAIIETKTSLDPLTVANFDNPPRTIMYDHFKRWVNTAYEELYIDRPEWFFRKERTIVTLRPRLYLGEASATIAAGDVLVGQDSGISFTVVDTHTHEESEQNLSNEITVSVDYGTATTPSELKLNEYLDRTNATPLVAAAKLLGLGYYDFQEEVPGLLDIDPESVSVYPLPSDTTGVSIHTSINANPVVFVPWPHNYEYAPKSGVYPQFMSKTPYGSYALFPQPDEPIQATFDYTRQILLMEDALDFPEALPSTDHMYLVWKAIEEYADYDNNAGVFKRAQKHLRKYDHYFDRERLPRFTLERSRF